MLRQALSKWTNEFIDRCEVIAGRKFDDAEVLQILDFAIGFLCGKEMEDYARQTVEQLGYDD